MPHLMFYAPNMTPKDFGAGPVMGPYPNSLQPGPHGYMIVNMGATEKAEINRQERDLIEEACAYSANLCLEGASPKSRRSEQSPH
jgi:hypothetical protein